MANEKKALTVIAAVSLLLSLVSCKKKNENTSSGNNITTTSGSVIVDANGDPTDSYSGWLFTSKMNNAGDYAEALFYTPPAKVQLFNYNTTTATVTSVSINGVKVPMSGVGDLFFPPAVWVINGGSEIPSFTYTNTTPLPLYDGTGLPQTINTATDLVIPLTGASGYDRIAIRIEGGGTHITMSTKAGASITFPTTLLANLSSVGTGGIRMWLYKYNVQTFGGKKFLFITSITYDYPNPITIQ